MVLPDKNLTPANRFWRARKRLRITQKELAFLLGHNQSVSISQYESGAKLPPLRLALRLEYILSVPAKILFQDIYLREKAKVEQQLKKSTYPSLFTREEDPLELCTYVDILEQPQPSQSELEKLRQHITQLARREAYFKIK